MACKGPCCAHCGQQCIANVSMLSGLSDEQQASIMMLAQHRDYKKGALLFSMDDVNDRILILRYGKVKISRFTEGGDELVLDIISAGDILGEQTVFAGEPYHAQGLCLEDTGICSLSASAIAKLTQAYPEVGMRLLGSLGRKLRDAQRLMELLTLDSAQARLCGFLLFRRERMDNSLVALSREDIASSINLRRETVSRKLSELNKEGIIELKGYKHIRILDEARLFELFHQPETA